MKAKDGLAPSVQDWIKQADTDTLKTKYVEHKLKREIKPRDVEFVAIIIGAIVAELGGRGEEVPEVEGVEKC